MTLTPAGRAEILRAAQRDEFFKEQLSNNASELLHLIGGVRLWLRYKDLVQMTIRIFYDILMTALNLQTLGEEFTGMVQVNRTATALPKKYHQLLMILVKNSGKLLSDGSLREYCRKFQDRERKPIQEDCIQYKILIVLNVFKKLLPILEKAHKALFFFNGNYYDTTKRLFGVKYVLVRYWLKDNSSPPAFRILGFFSVAYVLIHLISAIFNLKNMNNSLEEKSTTGILIRESTTVANKCPLCLNIRKHTSVTPCGHLFCWDCIMSWLQEQPKCPLCRQSVQPSRVVFLKNYSCPS